MCEEGGSLGRMGRKMTQKNPDKCALAMVSFMDKHQNIMPVQYSNLNRTNPVSIFTYTMALVRKLMEPKTM